MQIFALRNKAYISFLVSFFVVLGSLLPTIAAAQTSAIDFEAPIIVHDSVPEGKRGANQEFQVRVTDNIAVESVTLYYRFTGDTEYNTKEMISKASDAFYAAQVGTSAKSGSPIEYYFEARDVAENITLKGYSFDPLIRWLDPINERNLSADKPAVEPKKNRTLLYVLGGVAVLALVGGLASAGGSSGESSTTDIDTIDTINTNTTQTLTLQINTPGS